MAKAREVSWMTMFTREDGTPGSTMVKAKNEKAAREKARRVCKLSSTVEVKVRKC